MNAQYWYPFKFNFVVAHYYGAIVFVASLTLHVIVKLPVIARAYRERGVLKPLRDDLENTKPEPSGRARDAEPGARRRSRAAACSRSPAPGRACCWSRTSASRSAARCAGWPSSRRAASWPTATSRSTRPRAAARDHAGA